nr:hypothetical protein [Sphingomonas gellani]
MTAVMMMAQSVCADTAMLTEILPRIEAAIINPAEAGDEEEEDDHADA